MKWNWPACRAGLLTLSLLFNALPVAGLAQGRARRPAVQEVTEAPASIVVDAAGTLSEGAVLVCEVVTRLDSKTAQAGDLFRVRVSVPVEDEQQNTLIPAGSLIEGRVEFVQRAQSRRRSGIIEVSFSRLRINNETYPLNASLAPASEKDALIVDEEGIVRGKSGSTKRTVAFIGGGAGAGAMLGAITAGAVLGAGIGAGVGVFAVMMAKGKEAVAEPGREIGVQLNQPLTLRPVPDARNDARNDYSGNRPGNVSAPRNDAPIYSEPNYSNLPDSKSTYENPPPPGYETPRSTTPRPGNSRPVTPREDSAEAPRPVTPTPPSGNDKTTTTPPRARPTPQPNTPPVNTSPITTAKPAPARPATPPSSADASEMQMVSVSNLLAERGSDGKLRVSITGQTPTSGWKLSPEHSVENGILQIRLRGIPPQGMVAQVLSYPTTLVMVDDPDHTIQRVIVRGQTTSRSTVPITRGGNNSSANNSASGESFSSTGTRIADKIEGLVEDYAKWNRAWRQADGTYSFEDARTNTPEAQLLYAFDRLAESARVFRGSLTPEVKRRATRELTGGAAQINRLLSNARIPSEFTTRWQGIQKEINQLAAVGNTTTGAAAR